MIKLSLKRMEGRSDYWKEENHKLFWYFFKLQFLHKYGLNSLVGSSLRMSTGGFSFSGFGNTTKPATTTPAFGTSTTPSFGTSTTTSSFGSNWGTQAKSGAVGMGQQQQTAPNPISSLLRSYKYMFWMCKMT